MGKMHPEDANRFRLAWETSAAVSEVAEKLGIGVRKVHERRRRVEEYYKIRLPSLGGPPPAYLTQLERVESHATFHLDHAYTAIVFSDCHFWPELYDTPAFYLLCRVAEELDPDLLILNGDAFDGARISRHPSTGWDLRPSVLDELRACKEALGIIESAAPDAERYWCIGNHDLRFESHLAAHAPDFEGVQGFRLTDHFPAWHHAMSLSLSDQVMVKHRWHNGVHAAYNNTLKAGMSMITGHTHMLESRLFSDYRTDRYGMQDGTLADPWGPQFNYAENNARNWQAGFIVLTVDGEQHYPEMVKVERDGSAFFRGRKWRP